MFSPKNPFTQDDNKSSRTVLDSRQWFNKKFLSIAAAFTLMAAGTGALLTGCSEREPDPAEAAEHMEPEDIANLNDQKDGTLVQGRDACIKKMVANGMKEEEATKIYDEMRAEAVKEYKKTHPEYVEETDQSQPAAAATQDQDHTQPASFTLPQGQQQPTNVTVINNTTQQHSHSNDFLFWYLIMNNNSRPHVYYNAPSGGMTHIYGSGAHLTNLSPNQTTFLQTPHVNRPALITKISTQPGIRVVPVHGSGTTTTYHSTTSHGGFGGSGVGTGG